MNMETDSKKISQTQRVLTVFFGIGSLLVCLFMLWRLIAVGDLSSIIAFVITAIWLLIAVLVLFEKKKLFFKIGLIFFLLSIPIMGFILIFMMFGPYIDSTSPWKYNIQRSFIVVNRQGATPNFPSHLPNDIKSYKFNASPHVLQGAGHCSARFEASVDTIKEYESEYATKAKYILPISYFKDYYSTDVDNVSEKSETWSDNTDKSLKVWIDQDFWDGTDATVYVLSTNHNWDHPESSAVIISKDHTKVQFTQLG